MFTVYGTRTPAVVLRVVPSGKWFVIFMRITSPCPLGDAALGSHTQHHAVQDQLLFRVALLKAATTAAISAALGALFFSAVLFFMLLVHLRVVSITEVLSFGYASIILRLSKKVKHKNRF